MKKAPLLSLVATALFSLLLGAQARAEVSRVSIAVDGLGCPFCAYGLEKQLSRVEDVNSADIELKAGIALVTLEKGASPDIATFQQAVKKAGFTPRAVQITAIGTIQMKGEEALLSLRGSEGSYRLFAKDSANADLPAELRGRLAEFAESQTLVTVIGTPHDHADGQNGLSVDEVSPLASVAFSVDGMACEMCVARLTQLLEEREDVGHASVSLANKRVVVEAKDAATLDRDALIETINDAGFSASLERQ